MLYGVGIKATYEKIHSLFSLKDLNLHHYSLFSSFTTTSRSINQIFSVLLKNTITFNTIGDYNLPTDEELGKIARESAEKKVEFYTHIVIYIAVNALLIAIWAVTTGINSFPWFIFPLFGWGIGVVAHFIEAFRGKAYTERLAEKEYQRLKEKN